LASLGRAGAFLGLVLIAAPTAGMSLVLVHVGFLLAPDEIRSGWPVHRVSAVAFGSLGLVILAWVRLVERRSLATIGLTGLPATDFLRGHLVGLAWRPRPSRGSGS